MIKNINTTPKCHPVRSVAESQDPLTAVDSATARRMTGVVLCLCIVFVFFSLVACVANSEGGAIAKSSPPRIVIEGDVAGGFTRIDNTQDSTDFDVAPGDKDFHGVSLREFLEPAKIVGEPNEVYMMSADGFVACVNYADAGEIYVFYNDKKGFCISAPKLPVSASAQELSRMVVVSENSTVGLKIVKADGDEIILTKGKMLISPLTTSLKLQGSSEMGEGSEKYSSSVYTKELSATLAQLYEGYAGEAIVIQLKSGEKYLSDGEGRIIIGEKRFDYEEITGEVYEDIEFIQIR